METRAILPYFAHMAFFSGVSQRLARTPEEIRSENLRNWAETVEGRTPISEVQPRTRCRVAGVVQNLRIDPRPGRNSVEATLIDGTGDMVLKWLGRQELRGIRLGVGVIADGVAGADADGEPVILNPEYELEPGPEHN